MNRQGDKLLDCLADNRLIAECCKNLQNADLWRVQVAVHSPLAQLDEEIEALLPDHQNLYFIDKLIFSYLVHGRL